eukprot:5311306-Alexandrium_andersonii.AAC.1
MCCTGIVRVILQPIDVVEPDSQLAQPVSGCPASKLTETGSSPSGLSDYVAAIQELTEENGPAGLLKGADATLVHAASMSSPASGS